ncbi:hypothetical protein GCM10011584_23010 [Nocardioides phosphati]|uniref:DUF2336 domain-containing protein n=1 Tax=Nocardioides phosphati TaxID=1867775 RepID=A0ABQ2NAM7_9ACTN|nr:hypothetical protein [Nocardioides phosphati]GGO90674.1 hypothetical protein GCM10011584_23010 [Nocardioides phosphati]
MTTLEQQGELVRIARLLRVDVARLGDLAELSAATLRAFRDQVTERLFEADRSQVAGIAAATGLLPGGIAARIAEAVFPASLAARVAGLLGTDQAADLAGRLSPAYLAELAPHLDPREAGSLLAGLPTEVVAAAARHLADAGDYLAMADLVAEMPLPMVAAALEVIDDVTVLRTALCFTEPARLAEVVEVLPDVRLEGLLRAASVEDAWAGLLRALPHLTDEARERLAASAETLGDGLLIEGLLAAS